jgi:hypothetical protein
MPAAQRKSLAPVLIKCFSIKGNFSLNLFAGLKNREWIFADYQMVKLK